MLGRRNLCMLSFIEYIPSTFHILLTPSCTGGALLFQSSGFLAVSVSSILEEEDELVIKSINTNAICRTALATQERFYLPDLLMILLEK